MGACRTLHARLIRAMGFVLVSIHRVPPSIRVGRAIIPVTVRQYWISPMLPSPNTERTRTLPMALGLSLTKSRQKSTLVGAYWDVSWGVGVNIVSKETHPFPNSFDLVLCCVCPCSFFWQSGGDWRQCQSIDAISGWDCQRHQIVSHDGQSCGIDCGMGDRSRHPTSILDRPQFVGTILG